MNILLNGFFDKNFGDDAMQEMVVKHFPMHKFYINSNQYEMLAHLERYENVFIDVPHPDIDMFLNVIGTGFMYPNRHARVSKLFKMMSEKSVKYPKSALVNCSLEPFHARTEELFIKSDLKRYDFITCRDGVSFDYLDSRMKKAQVTMYNDMVFAGDYVHKSERRFLGIAPVSRVRSGDNYSYYKELAHLADSYIQTYNKGVKLFAFDTGYENDILAVTSIRNMMNNKHMAEIVAYNSDTHSFTKEFSECELIIGSRFHSIVLAAMNGIKLIAVYDNAKVRRICNDFDIMNIHKSNVNADIIMELIAHYKHYSADASDAKNHLATLEKFIAE